MCEANAYWMKDDQEELIMESVDQITPEGENNWELIGIFGDRKHIKGRISGMRLVEHKVFFEAVPD
jgi:predicted RNA-binding protein